MAYDKKTRTINIGEKDSQQDFEKDLFTYMADVAQQIEKDFPQAKRPVQPGLKKPATPTIKDKLHNLPKQKKAFLAFVVFWTAWVLFRTSDDYEILGIWLDDWDKNSFFLNWLGFPIVVGLVYFAYNWVVKEKKPEPKVNPLTEFEKEIQTWPAHQGKVALLLIKATLIGDEKQIDELYGELTVEQLMKVKAVMEKMEK